MALSGLRGILGNPGLPKGADLLREGAILARDWGVGPSAFLRHVGADSEWQHKTRAMAERRVMQHAQIGFRDVDKSCRAYAEIWDACARRGVTVDRYGLCLDWSMAVPRAARGRATRGTGMILPGVEAFVRLANSAPVAPHFGDFVLGFPAAVENTQAALAAGSTAIGNLGQYFTFRIPGWDDDVEATRATVVALGLIAAQPVPVMVHSNIDDGYAAQFTDLASCLGFILIERDLVTRLVGAPIGHCFGHHFSDPLARMAFQRALVLAGAAPGTVIYGNTTSYRGTPGQNYASLAAYLQVDALGQLTHPSGHAINPVPVTENDRIPEIEEVIDAQLFAGRLVEHAGDAQPLLADEAADQMAARLLDGAEAFRDATVRGLAEAGIDTADVFAVLLALRRIGARRLEAAFGAGSPDAAVPGGRRPVVAATILGEIAHLADTHLAPAAAQDLAAIKAAGLRVLVAAGDVHEHGKMLVEEMLRRMGVGVEDGGVSTDPEILGAAARRCRPDLVAVSTYNGTALDYVVRLRATLSAAGLDIPVLVGGRLKQIPDGSNTSMPVDVGDELAAAGAIVCREAKDLVPALRRAAAHRAMDDVAAE